MAGLTQAEIQEAVDLASKIKQGAHIALKNSINDMMGQEEAYEEPCNRKSQTSCC